jgi:CheY-like chemotaxis protein
MQRLAEPVGFMADHKEQPPRHTAPARAPGPLGAPHIAAGADPVAQLRWAQKMETLGRLTAQVVHEVNNQVTLMVNRTRLILQRGRTGGANRAEVEELSRAAESVGRLMRQWQTLGRREPPARRLLDVNAVVAATAEAFRIGLSSDMALQTDLRAARPWVLGDRGLLDHVALNLLANARDALGGSGTLTVRTANVELRGSADDFLLPFSPGPHVMFSVADTGCGMDRATLEHIFEPYFTTKPLGKGSGMGLHNVWEMVRESGGTLRVSSTLGQGSAFCVYLPEAPEESATVPAPARPTSRSAKPTILIVEDDNSVRSLLREVLLRQGYAVLEASDGPTALDLAASHAGPIQLLVCDCVLPHVSGAELAARLRERYPALRVLYVSGYPAADAVAAGGIDPGAPFLQKPFRPSALAAVVREELAARRQAVSEY